MFSNESEICDLNNVMNDKNIVFIIHKIKGKVWSRDVLSGLRARDSLVEYQSLC